MRFMMMVKASPESEQGDISNEAEFAAMGRYNDELTKVGALVSADGFKPSSKGKRVRIARGKTSVVDGPFAETKELIAGYWIIKAASKADAVAWARKVPFEDGEVEVRALHETEDFAVDPAEQPGGWRDKELEARAAPPPPRAPGTQRYALFLKADANTEREPPLAPSEKLLTEMGGLMEEMIKAGAMLSGDGLKSSKHGAKVRYAGGGKTQVIDGPFTESKEIIAGYCVCQTRTIDEAVEYARRMLQIHVEGTGIDAGEVEIRPFYELEDLPGLK